MFPMEQVEEAKTIVDGKAEAEVIVYPGAVHGCEYSDLGCKPVSLHD